MLLTLAVWAGLFIAVHFGQERMFRPTFARVESDLLVKDLERVEAAVRRETAQLSRTADDYASWEDMREFLTAGAGAEVPKALNAAILNTLDLDAIFVFDSAGRVRHALRRDLKGDRASCPEYTPQGFANQFPVIASVRTQGADAHSSEGLVRFHDGRLVFAVAAPVAQAGQARPLGTVVMLRELDAAGVTRLGEQVRLPLALQPSPPEGLSPAAKDAVPVIEGDRISGTAWLRDPFGQPIARFTVARHANILGEGERSIVASGAFSLATVTIVLSILMLVLQLSVVRPLKGLTRSVESVRRTGDLGIRVNMNRSDELGLLGYNFDRLLALLEERTKTLEDLATTDGLTRLSNRRTVMDFLASELRNLDNSGAALSVILLDVDHFKRINDTAGHAVGDRVLRQMAQVLKAGVKAPSRAGRYGGEEFLIVLPGMDRQAAVEVAESLRAKVASTPVQGVDWPVTASFGVASFAGHTAHGLLATADLNLYRAKETGRNRVVAEEIPFSSLPVASIPPPTLGPHIIFR
jgi:diguanylate cyclase (GGDEF)-like protein